MAFDIKAATPDATFAWSTAGFFGADSQASATPSYYATSVVLAALIATANTWTAAQTLASTTLGFSGNQSKAAWTTFGAKLLDTPGTLTDTTSSGTVADGRTNVLGGDTIAASAATTFTNYYTMFLKEPIAGSNVTMTNKWSLGLDGGLRVGGKILHRNAVDSNTAFVIQNAAGSEIFSIDATIRAAKFGDDAFSVSSSTGKTTLYNGGALAWQSGASASSGTSDVLLFRDAAGVLAQRNGVNAQTLRWYHSFTDLSNRQNGALKTAAGYVEVAAETAGTGASNIDVRLTPVGTGNVDLPGGTLLKTRAALTDGAAAALGTLTNAPVAGNPTKWVPINDNGTTRYIPCW